MDTSEFIHDRGRGPEIKGTRITIYSILDYLLEAWPTDRIAGFFQVRTEEVEAAILYLRDHKIEVLREYLKILERSERGNSPEVQAIIDANHPKFLELVEKVRQVKERGEEEIRELIRKHREAPKKDHVHAPSHGGQ